MRAFLVALGLLVSAGAEAQSLSEREAVHQALEATRADEIVASQLAAERASVAVETIVRNPEFAVSHERFLGTRDLREAETALSIHQEFDLSDWRGRLRDALPHQEAALRSERQEWELEVAHEVRTAFFSVRYHQLRVVVLEGWITRLQSGVDAAAQREAAGDVSEYDVLRVQRELDTAGADLASEWSQLNESWSGLQRWVPFDSHPDLVGELTPTQPSGAAAELPSLQRLRHLVAANEARSGAYGRPGLRGWSIGGGYLLGRAPDSTAHGFLVELSIPLVVRNNDRAVLDALAARSDAIEVELALEGALADRAQVAARTRLDGSLVALEGLAAPDNDYQLTRMAELAYQAGEASLTDLLDAYESEAELQLARVDLQWQARRAALDLDRTLGRGAIE
ncbi:MAG: outer membrane protein TolC [Bradymonadia bacterium]|jgi:outer membrane protein TolC